MFSVVMKMGIMTVKVMKFGTEDRPIGEIG
jgi:hypothetical protein